MSVLDKFLNVIKMNDDEYNEDDYLDEEETEEEQNIPPRRLIQRQEEDSFDDEPEREENLPPAAAPKPKAVSTTRRSAENSKISPIRSRRRGESSGMKVCVIRPHSMEDAREITDSLLTECSVILNLEGLELELAQRIIDFTSGSCYALDGNLQKVSTYIFAITPSSVDLTGDFQDILSDAFDVPFDRRS